MDKKTPLLLLMVVVFSLLLCGTVSAAELPLTTNQSGTVSGGLYFNASQPTPLSDQDQNTGVTQESNYNFAPSGYTNVTYAKFYAVVYTPTPEARECYVNVSFDGDNDGVYETILEDETLLNLKSDNVGNVYIVNDHINRVYSDYLLTYDVKQYITNSTVRAKVQTFPGSSTMDGRIKFLALVVAYNDGDYDRIDYWVNDGHQWFDSGSRQTTFNTSSLASGWNNAELTVVSTSSADATYKLNGIPKSGAGSVSNYFNVDTWNVTSDITPGLSSTLVYTNNGDSFKTQIAVLTVEYPQPTILADLVPETLVGPANPVVNQTYQINSTIANRGLTNAPEFQVSFYDNNALINTLKLDGLNKGETTNIVFSWKPTTTGLHNIKAVVDVLNQVQESKENNNEYTRPLDVDAKKADLVPLNMTIPTGPVVNETFQIKTNVTNSGLVDAGTFYVAFYDNGHEIGRQLVNALGLDGVVECVFNWTPISTGPHNFEVLVDIMNQVNESNETNNQIKGFVVAKDKKLSIFLISDDPGSVILNKAAYSVLEQYSGQVSIQIRTCTQIEEMSDNQLKAYLNSCDIFIGNWISTDVSEKIYNILKVNGDIAYNKKVFLVLEPDSTHADLMKYSVINGTRLLENYNSTQLSNYRLETQRNKNFTDIINYMSIVNFPSLYNTATLYKSLEDQNNALNEILWALNIYGFPTNFINPLYTSGKQDSGIYRNRWYTLEEYINEFFKSDRTGCVGLIESTLYVNSQNLEIYYKIIEELEERGLNVLPVTAYGASQQQLEIMVKIFTNATNATSFIDDPSQYLVRVDAIIEMPAYGMGGEDFTLATDFFTALNVPVLRAIHSDGLTNEQWELSTTGLPSDSGDKWWHVAISESQGVIEPTFAGGKADIIDPVTGAAIGNYVPYLANIELLADRIKGWVQLSYLPNSEKLVALIYYNYPVGKDNIGSSYLDTLSSLLNLLNILQANNYTVENIPQNEDALLELLVGNEEKGILPLGINVANWAPGVLSKLASNPNVILYPVEDYRAWFSNLDPLAQVQVTQGPVAYIGELCKKAVNINYTATMAARIDTWYAEVVALLPDENKTVAISILDQVVINLKNYISTGNISYYNVYLVLEQEFFHLNISGMCGWGESPGDIMVVEKDGKKYFVIPGIKFGNIFICPEPQRGWEADINKLYHSSAVAPPHQYLAVYAYLQQHTSAMVYMGRHATHEWLPGKEVLLSPYDFPSIVTGSVPQIYFYIVDGLAEGVQAKRRGLAVIIDHLTPPMTFTSLYGGYATLAALLDDYENANSTQKPNIALQIREVINTNNITIGVNTDSLDDDELFDALEAYLSDIQSTLYPYGLHAIGQLWSDNQIALLVTSMLSVEFQITNSTEITSLHDEISKILIGKTYDSISVSEREVIQTYCVGIVKTLIRIDDVGTVACEITSNPSKNLLQCLNLAKDYINRVNQSVVNEVTSFLKALSGGYIAPGAGDDPISNPNVLPTGTNFYDDQASEIPTKEAYEYGKILTLLALNNLNDTTEKFALGIWCVETARDDGALVSLVLYLLGMEPQWSDSPSAGVDGKKLMEMPKYLELDNLTRPDNWAKKRIDVVIVTSGLFRDLYSRQAVLMDNAFRIALARSYYTLVNDVSLKTKYGDQMQKALDALMDGISFYGVGSESLSDNYVAKHWLEDFDYYLSLNISAEDAGELAITRIFAPPEGDYGAGISKSVSEIWTWENREELADNFINRMGHMYTKNNWGTSNPAVFARSLLGISTIFTSRNTNLYGVVDNDDFFDYWGGWSMAIEKVNGKAPDMYVLDYSNRGNPQSLTIEQYINRELTTRDFNPEYMKGMMGQGYDGARYFSKFMKNLKGWAVTRPGSVSNNVWNQVVNYYFRDGHNIGVTEFLQKGGNAFAMISMAGTLLEMAYEGYWQADTATLQLVANKWAEMIVKNGVACCDCSCGNLAMMEWATTYVNADLLAHLNAMLYEATQQAAFAPGQTPASDPTGSTQTSSQSSSSQSSSQSESQDSGSSGSAGEEESESPTTPGEEGEGKAYEVSKQSSSGTSESGLPIAAVLGVIALVCLVGIGYFRGNFKGK